MIEDTTRQEQRTVNRRSQTDQVRAKRMGMAPSNSLRRHFVALARQVERWAGERTQPVTIGITSLTPQTGKSTVAFNLGFALTKVALGHVLLAEADFGKTFITRRMGVAKKPGLAELLEGQESIEGIFESPLEGLSVIGSGAETEQSALDLPFANLPGVVNDNFAGFSFVVFDLPVANNLTTCFSIAPHLDGLILTVDAGNIDPIQITRCRNQLHSLGIEVIGVVLNNA